MTGAEHYAKADAYLTQDFDELDDIEAALVIGKAQAHATLAFAAATAGERRDTGTYGVSDLCRCSYDEAGVRDETWRCPVQHGAPG